MINGKRVTVVMPAYNAEKTLKKTHNEIPHDIVDNIILTDDASQDRTAEVSRELNIKTFVHMTNKGYGGNQKTCYQEALRIGSDIVIMLHPDYQYTPKLITAMASMIAYGVFDAVIASRILGNKALEGGMPLYKYIANRFLTTAENLLIKQKLSEYHTGYRAYTSTVLEHINFEANSDDFIFDNQIISQIFMAGYEIAEITCPTRYFKEASSINFRRSVYYGLGVLLVSLMHWMSRRNIIEFEIYRVKSS